MLGTRWMIRVLVLMIEIMTKYFRWVGRGAILRPGWRWRRQRALPHIRFSLVDIEQIIQVRLNQTLSVIFVDLELIGTQICQNLPKSISQLDQVDRKLIEGAKRLNTNAPGTKWVLTFSFLGKWGLSFVRHCN